MKKIRKFRIITAFLSLMILFCAAAAVVSAAEDNSIPEIELDRKGSIFVTLAEENGRTPEDGLLMLIPVDKLENDFNSLDEDSSEELMEIFMHGSKSERIEMLRAFGTEVKIDSHGSAGFYDLPQGCYMIMQTVPSSGYYAISSFYVTIPMFADGKWIYDIDASPKTEALRSVPEPMPSSEEPEPETEAANRGSLPQTGQLNWPIPLLAGGGLMFVVIGLLLSHGKKNRHAS